MMSAWHDQKYVLISEYILSHADVPIEVWSIFFKMCASIYNNFAVL
jgi:hypothetical protein